MSRIRKKYIGGDSSKKNRAGRDPVNLVNGEMKEQKERGLKIPAIGTFILPMLRVPSHVKWQLQCHSCGTVPSTTVGPGRWNKSKAYYTFNESSC